MEKSPVLNREPCSKIIPEYKGGRLRMGIWVKIAIAILTVILPEIDKKK